MKFQLSLKSTQESILSDLKNKSAVDSLDELVKKSVKAALELDKNDEIFGSDREQCVGGCFAAAPTIELDLDDTDYNKLTEIFKNYDFADYESEEEEVSKTIRCIINFIDQEPSLIKI